MTIYDDAYFKKTFAELNAHKREMARIDAQGKRWFFGDDCEEPVAIADLVRAGHPTLTPNQHAALVTKLEEAVDEPTMRKKGWLRRSMDRIIEEAPQMVAKIPSPQELMSALGYDQLPPEKRISKFRELSGLSDDKRLALAPKDAAEKKETVPERQDEPTTAAKNFREMDDDELDAVMAAKHGQSVEQYRFARMPSEVMRNRAALRSSAPPPDPTGPAVDPNSEEFQKLSPTERINRFRAQAK